MAKIETVSIGQYLVSKDGKTKYLKLEANPKGDEATKKLVKDLIAVLGGDVIYVNLHDLEFREKYKIPDFVKGRINVEVKPSGSNSKSTKPSDDVPF